MSDMDPKKKEQYKAIVANAQAAEKDPSKILAERAGAQVAAINEVVSAAIRQKEEAGETVTDEERSAIEQAADVAVTFLYEIGSPVGDPAQIKSYLANYFKWQRLFEKDSPQKTWQPETDQDIDQVTGLVQVGSELGMLDADVAFAPSQEEAGGRKHEILDEPESKYNKYGFLITHGMKQGAAARRVDAA